MNADLHMADDLKNTGKGNLFVIFGEPDIAILAAENRQVRVEFKGVDVFHPNTGEVRSNGPEGIACWFIDTDYNEESFSSATPTFSARAIPMAAQDHPQGRNRPRSSETLNSDTSRPFASRLPGASPSRSSTTSGTR